MLDFELYQRIAGSIDPWTVGEIKVESDQRVEVQVECHKAIPKRCPHCDYMQLVCDNYGEEQTWRQPNDGSWQILLKGRLPLVECPEHGVVSVSPPWADWYVRGQDKSLLGPWSLQQIKLLMDVGRISPSTLLKRSGSDKWVMSANVTALFVKQAETLEPSLSADELAAVGGAIDNGPAISVSIQPTASDRIAPGGSASVGGPISIEPNDQPEGHCQYYDSTNNQRFHVNILNGSSG